MHQNIFIYPNTIDGCVLFYKHLVYHIMANKPKTLRYKRFSEIWLLYSNHRKIALNVQLCDKVFCIMAKFSNIEFVNYTLTKEHEQPLHEFMQKKFNTAEKVIEEIVALNYTVKIGFYPDNEAYGVFLAPQKDNHTNKGKMMSSWSDDLIEALAMVLYKHIVIFDGQEWETNQNSGKWG